MHDELERLIKMAYKDWKSEQLNNQEPHPDEETFACFLEDKLSPEEEEKIRAHLLACDTCAEIFSLQLKLKTGQLEDVPQGLIAQAKDLVQAAHEAPLLEIFLKLKEKALEVINTTGDVLVGQELVPAPLLRSRQIKDFKDEVIILKDFQDLRIEVKVEGCGTKAFNVTVTVKEKSTQKIIKDLRVTLIKDDLELESFLTDNGKVIFEHVLIGKYTLEISSVENKLACVLLDIRT
jgi:hypothetical protein